MKKVSLIIAFMLIFSFVVLAQSEQITDSDSSEKTKKVDEFGKAGDCDLSARVDNLFIEMNNQPNSKGYIILYKGKDFLPASYESDVYGRRIKQQISLRKYDSGRIVFIDGGFRESVTTEFFLVPENGEIPTPTDTVEKPLIPTDKTFLFDSANFDFYNVFDGYEGTDEEDFFLLPSVKARLEAEGLALEEEQARENSLEEPTEIDSNETTNVQIEVEQEVEEESKPTPEEIEEAKFYWAKENFGEMIKEQKDSHGVIVFYADDQYYDLSKLQTRLDEGKQRIAKQTNISPNKIEIMFGGYREFVMLEFWIVPKNGKPPTLKPDKSPKENENTVLN